MTDAVLVEGGTMDSLYPVTEQAKSWLSKACGSSEVLVLPVTDMAGIISTMRASGLEIEVNDGSQYGLPCTG